MAFGRVYGVVPLLRGRMAELKNRLTRARYFRGHGVHSPFVYAIVRQVFMRDSFLRSNTELFKALIAEGVSCRRALELQNLMTHCGYRTFVLCAGQDAEERAAADFYILLAGLPEQDTLRLVCEASEYGAAVAIVAPYADRKREKFCSTIVAKHGSTTVDNRAYILIFNNKNLPKQHFKI